MKQNPKSSWVREGGRGGNGVLYDALKERRVMFAGKIFKFETPSNLVGE